MRFKHVQLNNTINLLKKCLGDIAQLIGTTVRAAMCVKGIGLKSWRNMHLIN